MLFTRPLWYDRELMDTSTHFRNCAVEETTTSGTRLEGIFSLSDSMSTDERLRTGCPSALFSRIASRTSCACFASATFGQRIKALLVIGTPCLPSLWSSNLLKTGARYATVFPEPVGPAMITWSLFGLLLVSTISGIDSDWTTVGLSNPAFASALAVAGETPAASKVSNAGAAPLGPCWRADLDAADGDRKNEESRGSGGSSATIPFRSSGAVRG
mmetsp:Transcript_12017/g.29580  ORF Transcript_12017/g.29580 Transcript_12017/m.29580 type:complete len:215 (-) Transcript_12017:202-846(-)